MKITIILGIKDSSGGGESLHQLSQQLQKKYDCGIFYYDRLENSIPEKFKKYNVRVLDTVRDEKNSIVIVPDIYTGYLNDIKFAKKVIWWLSYNFYETSLPKNKAKKFLKKYRLPLFLTKPVITIAKNTKVIPEFMFNEIDFTKNNDIEHIYNCEYLKNRLQGMHISEDKLHYLCGPIAEDFFEVNYLKKENNVIFNPTKGKEFTEKIISFCQKKYTHIKFLPIQNMSEKQVYQCLSQSKLYIDFGEFPGPERIPREAVICGCNILTSLEGAAGNKYDVPIPKEFKFKREDQNIPIICKKINQSLNDYDVDYHKFDIYREKVQSQRKDFTTDILSIFKEIEEK